MTLFFYNGTGESNKKLPNVVFPILTEPIVRKNKKFEIAKSWKKFARIGTIGTSELDESINSSEVPCFRETSQITALVGNILYLTGKLNYISHLSKHLSIIYLYLFYFVSMEQ